MENLRFISVELEIHFIGVGRKRRRFAHGTLTYFPGCFGDLKHIQFLHSIVLTAEL